MLLCLGSPWSTRVFSSRAFPGDRVPRSLLGEEVYLLSSHILILPVLELSSETTQAALSIASTIYCDNINEEIIIFFGIFSFVSLPWRRLMPLFFWDQQSPVTILRRWTSFSFAKDCNMRFPLLRWTVLSEIWYSVPSIPLHIALE